MPTAPFWGTASTDPKRKFRWIAIFNNSDQEILQIAAKNVKKPSFEIGSVSHKWLNHTFHFPARLEWREISITLVDIGGATDIVTIVDQLMKNAGYQSPTDAAACRAAITKQDSVRFFGNRFKIVQLGGDGQAIETWELVNPWIKMVDYGDLDYGADDLVEISLSIQYDYAEKDPSVRDKTVAAAQAAANTLLRGSNTGVSQ